MKWFAPARINKTASKRRAALVTLNLKTVYHALCPELREAREKRN